MNNIVFFGSTFRRFFITLKTVTQTRYGPDYVRIRIFRRIPVIPQKHPCSFDIKNNVCEQLRTRLISKIRIKSGFAQTAISRPITAPLSTKVSGEINKKILPPLGIFQNERG